MSPEVDALSVYLIIVFSTSRCFSIKRSAAHHGSFAVLVLLFICSSCYYFLLLQTIDLDEVVPGDQFNEERERYVSFKFQKFNLQPTMSFPFAFHLFQLNQTGIQVVYARPHDLIFSFS